MRIDLTDPLAVMALTMAAEARSDGPAGMGAVGCVIRNRVEHPGWWGRDWLGVCLAPWQFSCWNPQTVGQPPDGNWRWMESATLGDRDVALPQLGADRFRQVLGGLVPGAHGRYPPA